MSEDSIELDGIKWGAEIAVNRQKPEWIEAGQKCIVITRVSGPAGWVEKHPDIGWSVVNAIRLPADHPYYAQEKREIDPALVERMVALVTRMGCAKGDQKVYIDAWIAEAGQILKSIEGDPVAQFQTANPDWPYLDRKTLIETALRWR